MRGKTAKVIDKVRGKDFFFVWQESRKDGVVQTGEILCSI